MRLAQVHCTCSVLYHMLRSIKGVLGAMAKGREISAESIGDVLDVARLRRQSGLLSAEHAKGGQIEEGELYLLAGLPIYARTGQLVGLDALKRILKWHRIYFSFATDVPQPPANISTSNLHEISIPSFAQGMANGTPKTRGVPQPGRPPGGSNGTRPPGVEWLVPQKLRAERDVLSLPLTRRQRFIYFLVDGRRTISDLARCTNKNIQEVELILSELQEQGLIAL
jgi:hypothetical protein